MKVEKAKLFNKPFLVELRFTYKVLFYNAFTIKAVSPQDTAFSYLLVICLIICYFYKPTFDAISDLLIANSTVFSAEISS